LVPVRKDIPGRAKNLPGGMKAVPSEGMRGRKETVIQALLHPGRENLKVMTPEREMKIMITGKAAGAGR
jgi:hypothetical protein